MLLKYIENVAQFLIFKEWAVIEFLF